MFEARWIELLIGMHRIQLEQAVLFLNWCCEEDEDMNELLPRLLELLQEGKQAHKHLIDFQRKKRKKL